MAQLRVVRRVGEAQPAGVELGGHPRATDEVAEVIAVGVVIGQHLPDLVVPRDQPAAESPRQRDPSNRTLGAIKDRVEPVTSQCDENGFRERGEHPGGVGSPHSHRQTGKSPTHHL